MHPFPHIPSGSFKVRIQPFEKDGNWIEANINPIIVTMEEGGGIIELTSGFEIMAADKTGAISWSELDWLIESGQYELIKKPG